MALLQHGSQFLHMSWLSQSDVQSWDLLLQLLVLGIQVIWKINKENSQIMLQHLIWWMENFLLSVWPVKASEKYNPSYSCLSKDQKQPQGTADHLAIVQSNFNLGLWPLPACCAEPDKAIGCLVCAVRCSCSVLFSLRDFWRRSRMILWQTASKGHCTF